MNQALSNIQAFLYLPANITESGPRLTPGKCLNKLSRYQNVNQVIHKPNLAGNQNHFGGLILCMK